MFDKFDALVKAYLSILSDHPKKRIVILEHNKYVNVPGSSRSARKDSGNTNTKTIEHYHIFAKPNGKGKEMYAVNRDGSGHDGSNGYSIPISDADFFRSKGYNIPPDNMLRSITIKECVEKEFELIFLICG